MVQDSSYLLSILALLAVSGCTSFRHVTILNRRETPTETKDPSLSHLTLEERPQSSSAEAVSRVSDERSSANLAAQRSAARDVPVQGVTFRGQSVAMVSSQPFSAFAEVEPTLDGAAVGPLQLEPPSGDLTFKGLFSNQAKGVVSDVQHFYSPEGMVWLVGGLGVGAVMANTGFDEHFMRDSYSENVVLAPSDELYENLHQPKFLGNGYYTIPAFAIAALSEPLIGDLPLGSETAEWGQRSLRTILVGGPPMLGLQWLTGGGRPDETRESSEWRPFQDNNGISGHAFMGAIPFMSAAKMTDDIWLKAGLYAASTLPAISRVNDDAHFFSQAFLGWWLAYLAESAVDQSVKPDASRRWHISPSAYGEGVVLSTQW